MIFIVIHFGACACVGMRTRHHFQLWKGLFYTGWIADWRRNAGDIEKECAESDRRTRCTSRGQYSRWYVWLINQKKKNRKKTKNLWKKQRNLNMNWRCLLTNTMSSSLSSTEWSDDRWNWSETKRHRTSSISDENKKMCLFLQFYFLHLLFFVFHYSEADNSFFLFIFVILCFVQKFSLFVCVTVFLLLFRCCVLFFPQKKKSFHNLWLD